MITIALRSDPEASTPDAAPVNHFTVHPFFPTHHQTYDAGHVATLTYLYRHASDRARLEAAMLALAAERGETNLFTLDAFLDLIAETNIGDQLARLTGDTQATVDNWIGGDTPPPICVWTILTLLALQPRDDRQALLAKLPSHKRRTAAIAPSSNDCPDEMVWAILTGNSNQMPTLH